MKNPLAGIPKNSFVLGLASFLNDIASEMVAPILPIFLTTTLGVGPAAIGLIEGIADATSSLLKVVAGYISDRIGKRKAIVFAGYGMAAIARSAVAISTSWLQVLAFRFTDRIGKGIRTAPRDAIIADSTDKKFLGKSFGLHRALDHAGAVVGPLAAFFLISRSGFDYRTIIAIAIIPGVLSALSIAAFVREKTIQKKITNISLQLKSVDKSFHYYLIILFVFTLGNASDAFLILRAVDAGMPTSFIPLLWAGFNLVKFFVSVPGGSLSDKIGRRPLIIAAWLIYALIYALFAFANSPLQIAILFAIYGVYYGLTEGVERAFIADLVPENIRATAYGLYNAAIGLAALPASVVFGFIWKYIGLQTAFMWSVALALLASIGLSFLTTTPHSTRFRDS